MSFSKTATVSIIPLALGRSDGTGVVFEKTAGTNSNYASKASDIDVKSILDMVADKYKISNNPSDFIFEAVRAVTADEPNQNGDAFPRSELLRFDHRLGRAVYQTFIGKPHHINHRADNPKTARGVIIDAHYNDSEPAKDTCPACNAKTAAAEDRDESGLNCKKCGSMVKDEFVELLLAIDTKKDPTFADGVRTGALDSLSMGCNAGYTDCSICNNRARTVAQFCSHIKSGNKKKMFKAASGVSRMSFEKCGEVIFTELSRVDQPADPKAKQREIFKVDPMSFKAESELLIMSARIAKLERQAQASGDSTELNKALDSLKNTHPELAMTIEKALGDTGAPGVSDGNTFDDYTKDKLESNSQDKTMGEMGILDTDQMGAGNTQGGQGGAEAQGPNMPGMQASVSRNKVIEIIASEIDAIEGINKERNVNANLFANSYKDVEVAITDKGNVSVFTPKGSLFVIRPKVKPVGEEASTNMCREVLAHIAERGMVSAMTEYNALVSPKIAQVLQFHVEDFDGGREEGDKKPAHEDGEVDMADGREKPESSVITEEITDAAEGHEHVTLSVSVLDGVERDHAEAPDGMKPAAEEEHTDRRDDRESDGLKTMLSDAITDYADKKPKTATKTAQSDMPGAPPVMEQAAAGPMCHNEACLMSGKTAGTECECGPDCDCKCGCKCDKTAQLASPGPVVASIKKEAAKYTSRLERIYKTRFDNIKKQAAEKVATAEKTAMARVQDRFTRALKLAATRQALNLEASPLKAAMHDTLTSKLDIDDSSFYPGMDSETAAYIVEAASRDGFNEFTDALLSRAAEFASMSDEAFSAIEKDVQNLRPLPVSVTAAPKTAATTVRETTRKAAIDGNLQLQPSPADALSDVTNNEIISTDSGRKNIRSALGTTRVGRTSQNFKK